MAAALYIIIIIGALRRGQINKKSCTQIVLDPSLDKIIPDMWG